MEKQEINEILYSITKQPRYVQVTELAKDDILFRKEVIIKKGEVHSHLIQTKFIKESDYDLWNRDHIHNGALIIKATNKDYDIPFKKIINSYKRDSKTELFLNHHFEHTHNKLELLSRIETYITIEHITNQFTDVLLTEGKKTLVENWITEKKKKIAEKEDYITLCDINLKLVSLLEKKKEQPKKNKDNEKQNSLFKENHEASAIKAFEDVMYKGKTRTTPIHIKAAFIAFQTKNVLEVGITQAKFLKDFGLKFGVKIDGGKNSQIDKSSKTIMQLSDKIIAYL